jgi:NADPH:quinone reductase-like Zn-dependent oxidoreductase
MRVAAFSECFDNKGAPDYGAFQERMIVPSANAVPLPDDISFNQGTLLPMAVYTTFAGMYTLGVPFDTSYSPEDKQGILVWGGSSSVGSGVIQVAKLMGFTVYTTASPKHHAYLKTLGASRVFDYKAENVEASIIKAGKEDGLTFKVMYDAVGQIKPVLAVFKELKVPGPVIVAEAAVLREETPLVEDVEVKFVLAPKDEKAQTSSDFFRFVFNVWLKERLAKKDYVPSPSLTLLEGGLEGLNRGLDAWKAGVSGEKIVLEIS